MISYRNDYHYYRTDWRFSRSTRIPTPTSRTPS